MLTATALTPSTTVPTHTDEDPFGSGGASRYVDLETWRGSGVPLLRSPRPLVTRLHELHRPAPGTAVVAVLDEQERPVASASFAMEGADDGWSCRNLVLRNLRRIVPDDLRRTTPSRVTVLLLYREGGRDWQPADGAWMWGFADACALHGLRRGAFTVVSHDGWRIAGDGRGGRGPSTAPAREPARPRPARTGRRARRAPAPVPPPAAAPAATAPVRPLPDGGPTTPVTAPAAAIGIPAPRPAVAVPAPAAASPGTQGTPWAASAPRVHYLGEGPEVRVADGAGGLGRLGLPLPGPAPRTA